MNALLLCSRVLSTTIWPFLKSGTKHSLKLRGFTVHRQFVRIAGAAKLQVLLWTCFLLAGGYVAVSECAEYKIQEIIIKHQSQRHIADSAQTVLDMLGYQGHMRFPSGKVKVDNFRAIPGARELDFESGREEDIDYNYPKVWFIQGNGSIAGKLHWVIRHKGTIYSPYLGEINAEEFKQEYMVSILYIFEIPVLGQMGPQQYYQQIAEDKKKTVNTPSPPTSHIYNSRKKLGAQAHLPDVETDIHR